MTAPEDLICVTGSLFLAAESRAIVMPHVRGPLITGRCHVTTKQGRSRADRSKSSLWKEEAMNTAFWLRVGAIWGFLAVAIGAFGAHGLKDRFKSLGDQFGPLTTERPEGIFQTATHYHAYCALAIVAVGLLAANGRNGAALQVAGWSFLLGSLIFSGSLYVLAGTGIKKLGMITPIGGVLMLIGWVALALAAGSKSS